VRSFNIIKIGLELPREVLYDRINKRVDQMRKAGLVEEATALHPFKDLQPLQTVGYQEIFDFLDGKQSKSDAIDKIKQNSRNYAKRQLTWFKKDEEVKWFSADKKDILKQIVTLV
jgi:tRNA dimethylallyltransferase